MLEAMRGESNVPNFHKNEHRSSPTQQGSWRRLSKAPSAQALTYNFSLDKQNKFWKEGGEIEAVTCIIFQDSALISFQKNPCN